MICVLAACMVLMPDLILASGSETSPPQELGAKAEENQVTPLSLLVAQARRHPSYQVFAHHVALPSIIGVENSKLRVGEKVEVDISRWDQLSEHQKQTLADQFEIPVGAVHKLLERFTNNALLNVEQAGQELRTNLIDYKYLQEKWAQYIPPTGEEKIKTDALQALRVGEIDKVWETYLALPRPQPPAGLQIVRDN